MTEATVFAVVACIALAIAAFVVVNHARVYSQMIKANAEIAERAANYQSVLNANVDRRIEVVTEVSKKMQTFRTKAQGPAEAEAPLPPEFNGELRPNIHDEESERAREIGEAFPGHPDAMRRDEINFEA